jgi:hypothetical protein
VVVVPVVGMAPLQPPDAAQELAFVALHCNVTGEPIATVASLAFKVTKGGAETTGDVAPLLVAELLCAVLSVGVLLEVDVSAFELAPHAARELTATKPSIDFNANANLERRLRRIELITRLPKKLLRQLFRGARFHSSAIFEITYSFDIFVSPTCRHLQTTYV